jgi:hypothetical protein
MSWCAKRHEINCKHYKEMHNLGYYQKQKKKNSHCSLRSLMISGKNEMMTYHENDNFRLQTSIAQNIITKNLDRCLFSIIISNSLVHENMCEKIR